MLILKRPGVEVVHVQNAESYVLAQESSNALQGRGLKNNPHRRNKAEVHGKLFNDSFFGMLRRPGPLSSRFLSLGQDLQVVAQGELPSTPPTDRY